MCSALRRRRKTTAGVALAARSEGASHRGYSGGELRSGSGSSGTVKGGRRRRPQVRRRVAGGSSRQEWASAVDGGDMEAR